MNLRLFVRLVILFKQTVPCTFADLVNYLFLYHCSISWLDWICHYFSTIEETFIVGFFIPVSSLKVFDHSIHSERRMIYQGKSIQALQNDTNIRSWLFSFRTIQPTGQWQTFLKVFKKNLCLFSSILVHYNNKKFIWISATIYKPKLSYGLTSYFMLDRLHRFDVSNKGIEQACSWLSCDIHISPLSINLHLRL